MGSEQSTPTAAAQQDPEDRVINVDDDDEEEHGILDVPEASAPSGHLQQLKQPLKSTGPLQVDIQTKQQAQDRVDAVHGSESLEARVLSVLHAEWFELLMAGLLGLDVVILFVELALLTVYPTCHTITRDAVSCCPKEADGAADESHDAGDADDHHFLMRFLAGSSSDGHGDGHHHNYCETPGTYPMEQYEAGCDSHKWHRVHTAEEWLFGTTMFILFVFLVENLVMVWALKPRVFFRQAFYVADLAIVTISIVLEMTFHYVDDDVMQAVFGLLIFIRIWRFVRIGHGVVEITSDAARHKYEVLVEYTEELELLLQQHQIALPQHLEKIAHKASKIQKHSHHHSKSFSHKQSSSLGATTNDEDTSNE